jgi:ABC-type polysaccharide transport system permease subunit
MGGMFTIRHGWFMMFMPVYGNGIVFSQFRPVLNGSETVSIHGGLWLCFANMNVFLGRC